ncbi:POT family MFS transporter [Nitrospira sp. M1]
MSKRSFRTTPLPTDGMPPGVFHLVANEGAERFSFYGMRAILIVFMTELLLNQDGALDVMTDAEARAHFHLFTSAVYFFPFLGALLADGWLGKYNTIIPLSLVYCAGHFALAVDQTRVGLLIGLTLIAIGSGGIKPCVSAVLGDQFGMRNQHLLSQAFSWFYFSINFGAFISTLLTPWLLKHYGPDVAFGVPGLLMLCATFVFWLGRYEYVHVHPQPRQFLAELKSAEVWQATLKLSGIFLFVAFFWSLYDQTSSAWVLQAKQMDRHWLGIDWLSSQVQAVNPILIMIFIPVFTYGIYPAIDRIFPLTPLRKISMGFFVTMFAFLISASIEQQIEAGLRPNIVWQLVAYVVMTGAEVMVSITCLEFSYTQAPLKLKSVIMSLFLLSVSLGNAFTSFVNYFIQNPDGTTWLNGASYYYFFSGIMLIVSILFIFVAKSYREERHFHGESSQA